MPYECYNVSERGEEETVGDCEHLQEESGGAFEGDVEVKNDDAE